MGKVCSLTSRPADEFHSAPNEGAALIRSCAEGVMCSSGSCSSAAAASQASQYLVSQQISIGVARLALNAQQQQGDAANQLLAAAAKLSQAIGKGQRFDAVG
jgi:galactitol-specific phosphotransferase system IIB component